MSSTRASDAGDGDDDRSADTTCRFVFEPGDKVEVRSHEEGFRGAWYEAEIVRRLRGRHRYSVDYVSLVSEEDHSQPLRESVSRSDIRPRPPPHVASGDVCYHLHDPVEAFHNDGWWFGIITSVPLPPGGGRYTVCFPTSREVIQFEHSDLRPQLHWVKNRQWVPTEEMDHPKPTFNAGDRVQVSSYQEEYDIAWFDAVVFKVFGSHAFFVEYESVKTENAGELLKEIVSHDYMRPSGQLLLGVPPQLKSFASGDEVEALLNCGWLPGTLLEALDEEKYLIELKHSKQRLKFDCSEMRHLRVRNGSCWVYKNKKVQNFLGVDGVKTPKRKKMAGRSSSLPIYLSDSNDESEVAHQSKGDKTLAQLANVNNSPKRSRAEAAPDLCLSSKATPSDYTTIQKLDGTSFGMCSVIPSGMEIEKHTPAPIVEDDTSMDERCTSKSPSYNFSDISNPLTSEFQLIHNVSTSNDVQKPSGDHELSVFNHHGSRHEAKSLKIFNHDGSRHEAKSLKGNEHHGLPPLPKWSNSKWLLASKVTVEKRRKRLATRYPKRRKMAIDAGLRAQSQNQITPMEGDVPPDKCTSEIRGPIQCESENFEKSLNEVMGSGDNMQKDDLNHDLLVGKSLTLCQQKEVLRSSPLLLDTSSELICIPHLCTLFESLSANDEINIPTIGKQVGNMQDACLISNVESRVSNTTMINCSTSEPSPVVRSLSVKIKLTVASMFCNLPSNATISAENQIVATQHEDSSPIHVDSTQTRSPLKMITVDNERASFNPSPNASSLKKVPLPFIKSSIMWESIETMEVFHQLPQEPHFRPLEKYCMEIREGMAIGLMVSFANLVSNTLKLSISDNQTIIEEKLRALEDLEANGFHVASLRMRLKELLQIQVSRIETGTRKAMLAAKMLDKRDERDKLVAKIAFCDRTIGKMEESLACLRENRDMVLKEKESYESEFLKLKREAQVAEDVFRLLKNSN